jgi:hypothetical protein
MVRHANRHDGIYVLRCANLGLVLSLFCTSRLRGLF